MLTQTQVRRYSAQSGLRDMMIAEKEVVLIAHKRADSTRDLSGGSSTTLPSYRCNTPSSHVCPKSYGDSTCSLLGGAAMPKKTRTARFSHTMSSSARRPTCAPIFVFGMVETLSTIKRQSARNPLVSLGLIRSRKRGASVGSVVNAHTVRESVMSKRSS
jgi:hypothetical protein